MAQELLRDYQVADPKMVRATYDQDAPLEGRDMLLEIRFLGIPVNRTGCRVGRVIDEQREVDGRPVRVWGWSYQTLEGHFEQGEMCWMVWKWMDTGEVQFRIHSYMRNAEKVNPVSNLGFKIFGQHERRRYLQGACERMARLTAAALALSALAGSVERFVAEEVLPERRRVGRGRRAARFRDGTAACARRPRRARARARTAGRA